MSATCAANGCGCPARVGGFCAGCWARLPAFQRDGIKAARGDLRRIRQMAAGCDLNPTGDRKQAVADLIDLRPDLYAQRSAHV